MSAFELSPQDREAFEAIEAEFIAAELLGDVAEVRIAKCVELHEHRSQPFPVSTHKPFGPDPDVRFKRQHGE